MFFKADPSHQRLLLSSPSRVCSSSVSKLSTAVLTSSPAIRHMGRLYASAVVSLDPPTTWLPRSVLDSDSIEHRSNHRWLYIFCPTSAIPVKIDDRGGAFGLLLDIQCFS